MPLRSVSTLQELEVVVIPVWNILLFTLIPAVSMAAGSMLAIWRMPGPGVRSAMQHLASGIVFAAIATELVPEMIEGRRYVPLLSGFIIGVGTMMAIRLLDSRSGAEVNRGPWGLLAATGIDLLIDGLLIGIGFGLVASSGWLLTIAITFEVLFVGCSLAVTLIARGMRRRAAACSLCLIGLLVPGGASIGYLVYGSLDSAFQIAILSFGSAALLYLVTEELLVEAHEEGETAVGSTLLFVGFGLSLVLSMLLGS